MFFTWMAEVAFSTPWSVAVLVAPVTNGVP
jgi:hypothetical protein